MKHFYFYCPTQIAFGTQRRNELTKILANNGWHRVGFVIDHNLRTQEAVADLIAKINTATRHLITGWCTISEPTYDDLETMREIFMDQELQVIIGIGGGSTLDMAKAMAVLVNNRKPAIFYRGFDKMTEAVLPIVTIPTTAGTGSEITPNASFIDSKEKRKMGINGEAIRPRYAILDPEFTLSCPKYPTVSAAVDSIVHAVEAFIAKKSTSIAKFFAKEGFKKVILSLPQLIDDLENIDLRQDVMYGAFISGVALMHSGTGPAAAMSYPLGVHYHVPHGIGGGIFLPYVVEHNVKHGVTNYAALYQVMDEADMTLSVSQQTEKFVANLFKTLRQVGVTDDITQFGFNAEGIKAFISDTMELKGALDQNPVPFCENEIENTLRNLMKESHE